MITIDRLTDRQLFEMFGDPVSDPERVKKNIVKIKPPFELITESGQPIKLVEINKFIADSWVDALQEIAEMYGDAEIKKRRLNVFGGCFNIRAAKGNTKFLSRHSWGVAVDHCMTLGPYGSRDVMPYHFVHAFIKRGWDWGGHWPEKYPGCKVLDGMHFSVGG